MVSASRTPPQRYASPLRRVSDGPPVEIITLRGAFCKNPPTDMTCTRQDERVKSRTASIALIGPDSHRD